MTEEESNESTGTSAVTEEDKEFDPSSFLAEDDVKPEENEESTEESEAESTEDVESTTKEVAESTEKPNAEGSKESTEETTKVESDSDWGVVSETESSTEDSTEEEEEEETVKAAPKGEAWKSLAEDLGIEAESVDEFKKALLNQKELAKKGMSNQKVETWRGLKTLSDEEIVKKQLEAQGRLSEDEIEDELDIMTENRMLASKARDIRSELDTIIDKEIEDLSAQTHTQDSKSDEEAEEARLELREYLSKTDVFFGGRVNEKQKDEHFEYIESGKYFDEVTQDAESIAKAAWLWRHKDQIQKAMSNSGFEKGKASILNKITHPETTKTTSVPNPDTGEFNTNKFLETETM